MGIAIQRTYVQTMNAEYARQPTKIGLQFYDLTGAAHGTTEYGIENPAQPGEYIVSKTLNTAWGRGFLAWIWTGSPAVIGFEAVPVDFTTELLTFSPDGGLISHVLNSPMGYSIPSYIVQGTPTVGNVPKPYNVEVSRGTYFPMQVPIIDPITMLPFDLTDYGYSFSVKADYDNPDTGSYPLIHKTSATIANPTAGIIDVEILPADTYEDPATQPYPKFPVDTPRYYSVKIFSADNPDQQYPAAQGKFLVQSFGVLLQARA